MKECVSMDGCITLSKAKSGLIRKGLLCLQIYTKN